FGGLDLSGKHDLTALVLAFPTDDKPAHFDLLPFFWTPEGQMAKRTPAERERFREWIAAGHMKALPGDVITTALIAADIVALVDEFDLKTIAFDRWHIEYL